MSAALRAIRDVAIVSGTRAASEPRDAGQALYAFRQDDQSERSRKRDAMRTAGVTELDMDRVDFFVKNNTKEFHRFSQDTKVTADAMTWTQKVQMALWLKENCR